MADEVAAQFAIRLLPSAERLRGRSMLVRRTTPVPIECVARGYLAGSAWKEYTRTGSICGIALPLGLREADRLAAPIFTPATKAESGHDENISAANAAALIGTDALAFLERVTLALYARAAAHAESRGIILADTKFEFGLTDQNEIILIDEVLTPDSSRYWPKDQYAPGGPQPHHQPPRWPPRVRIWRTPSWILNTPELLLPSTAW